MKGSDYATGLSAGANREAYANAVAVLERSGQYAVNRDPVGNQKKMMLTESYLRTEMPLSTSKTSYNFGVLNTQITNGQSGLYETEQRITLQDVLFVYNVGFYVTMNRTSGGNVSYQNQLMTFPNPQFYLSSGINLDLMTGLWNNGQIELTINGQVVTPGWDLRKHMYIPQTQIDTNTPSTNGAFFNQVRQRDEGMQTVEPNWIFNGGNNIQLNVVYKTSLTNIGIADTASLRLVLIMEGFLAQNASSIMDQNK